MSRVVALFAPVLLAAPSVAADPLADTVRDAMAAHNLRETDLHGNATARSPYRDGASDGAVLVGLEVGLGGPATGERVVAIRPVYRLGGRDRTGAPAGRFLSDEVSRTVRLIARPGYAVSGLTVSAGRRLDGVALRFARLDRAGLDPAQTYESAWVGSTGADGRAALGGEGQPVTGVFGRLEGDAIVAIGLVLADLPRPVTPPASTSPVSVPAPISALERDRPTKTVEATTSGGRVWVLVVLGGVGLTAAGVMLARARRRKPRGVQQLPRLPSPRRSGPSLLEGPPSIPGNVMPGLLATTTPPPGHQTTRLDADFVWR